MKDSLIEDRKINKLSEIYIDIVINLTEILN